MTNGRPVTGFSIDNLSITGICPAETVYVVRTFRSKKSSLIAALKAEDLVLELADGTSLGVSERLGGLLHGANHGRRTAEQNLDVARGSREALLEKSVSGQCRKTDAEDLTYLDHVRGDETDTTSPALRRVVEDVVDAETVVLLGQLLKLILHEDIVGVHVGEDQVDLGGVVSTVTGTVANDSLDDLVHGGDTSTTGDHTNVTAHVGSVHHGALGATDLHGLTNLQGSQVLGDVTLGVGLDKEIEVASLIVRGDGGVGADNLLTANGGGKRDVLTDGETQDIGGTGQGETVDSDIVRDVVLLLQGEVLEITGVEDLSGL